MAPRSRFWSSDAGFLVATTEPQHRPSPLEITGMRVGMKLCRKVLEQLCGLQPGPHG
jgi:hypothetical protein